MTNLTPRDFKKLSQQSANENTDRQEYLFNLFMEQIHLAAKSSYDIPLFIDINQILSLNEEAILKKKFSKIGWDLQYFFHLTNGSRYVLYEKSWKNIFKRKKII